MAHYDLSPAREKEYYTNKYWLLSVIVIDSRFNVYKMELSKMTWEIFCEWLGAIGSVASIVSLGLFFWAGWTLTKFKHQLILREKTPIHFKKLS